ncbi:MAG: sulfotransferase [Pseudoxanthomonas sp.]
MKQVEPTQAELSQSLWQRAELHASRKEWPDAAACFRSLLAMHPGDAKVLVQLSYIESLAGHYRMARDYALRAHASRPRDADTIKELIARLRTFNETAALNECIDRLQPLSAVSIPLLIAFAAQLSNLNEQERALVLLDEAKRGDPGYPPVLLARGQVLTYLGRFDEARAELLQCQRKAPEIAPTYWWLSRLGKQTTGSNHIDAIRQQLDRPGRKPEEIAFLAYALHKSLDDLGDYPAAWLALEQACRAKRSRLDYRREQSVDLVDRLIALPTATTSSFVPGGPTPIFIVGMHRSGTTLLEQMLDGHQNVRALGELYDFTSQMRLATDYHCRGVIDATLVDRARGLPLADVGQGYLDGVGWRLGRERFFTDKLPSNFLNLGFICQALPHAKILHMVRDPMETCFSNLRELFSDACPYSYDQSELADYHRQYQRLMRYWQQRFPGRILDVDYAALTGEPEPTLATVASFCGLDYQPGMLDLQRRERGVSTASAVQVRGQVRALETPKWKPYESFLQPLMAAL